MGKYKTAIAAVTKGERFVCNILLTSVGISPYIENGNTNFTTAEGKNNLIKQLFPEFMLFQPIDKSDLWFNHSDKDYYEIDQQEVRQIMLEFSIAMLETN